MTPPDSIPLWLGLPLAAALWGYLALDYLARHHRKAQPVSRHHEASKHASKAPSVRKLIERTLPAPCEECGRPVLPDQAWHVAHRVPASQGGQTTIANCGPAHAGCNLRAGGRLGAAITNGRRRQSIGRRQW